MIRFSMAAMTLAGVALVGCNGGGDSGDTGAECDNTVEFFPADGVSGAYYRTTVEVEFDDVESDATLTITDSDGTEVAGETTTVGDTLIFTPTAPLSASSDYTTTLTFSCGTVAAEWSTSAVGTPLSTPADLEGKTFTMDLGAGRFLEPEGLGSLISSYLTQDLLVGVTDYDDASTPTLKMSGSVAEEGATTQDTCASTVDFPDAAFDDNPFFEIGPQDTDFSISGYDITISDLKVSGAFAPDATSVAGAVLEGTIDTSAFGPLLAELGVGDDCDAPEDCPDALCTFATGFGITCDPCDGDSARPYCISVKIDSLTATELSGVSLVKVEHGGTVEADVSVDPCLTECYCAEDFVPDTDGDGDVDADDIAADCPNGTYEDSNTCPS